MEKIYKNICELVGNTPLIELAVFGKNHCPNARLVAKAERFNPAGSAKDRIALNLLQSALRDGKLAPGGTVIEPTSGNTGVGIAAISAVMGFHAIIVMPDSMSLERRKLIAAYGAEIVLTPGAEGMAGAIKKAEELQAGKPGSIIAGQFENPENPRAHYLSTGPEIWRDTEGHIDAFVAGVGTGGTITGAGRYLKEQNSRIRIVAMEPSGSAVLSGEPGGKHKIQGIGAGFVPKALDTGVYDEVVKITDEEAYDAMTELAKTEGLLVGISSGAAALAAAKVAARAEFAGRTVVVLLPDTGERYLSIM
ncbi:MAG: cysteine synthase A [Oscillospiraceae bacterium]